MKKIAAYFSIIFGIIVLVASSSYFFMDRISAVREAAPWGVWWGPHQVSDIGDLTRMGYLENIPKFRDTGGYIFIKQDKGNQKIDLYLYGDSFVKDFPDSVYYGINNFHFARRDFTDLVYNLDTGKTNILIIAIAERFVRTFFNKPDGIYEDVRKGTDVAYDTKFVPRLLSAPINYAGFTFPRIDMLFMMAVNQNIEYNLFTYNFLNRFRTFKPTMNYYLFNRGSGDVVISDDGTFLFIRESVNNYKYSSSYAHVPETEVSYSVSVFNEIYEHYRNEGFDEVYLSVIPNPATIVQPEYYNGYIPDLQNPARGYPLKMPVIDVYSPFIYSDNPRQYFKRGDTHWNAKGAQVWIDKVNEQLRKWDTVAVNR